MSLPKLVVFDLDYTLWPCWCDTHVSPPFKSGPNGTHVIDSAGMEMQFYKDVPEVLQHLHEQGIKAASASRTWDPSTAKSMLRMLKVGDKSASNWLCHSAWGTGSKTKHFQELHKKTGVDFKDMVFFDDEPRNRDVEKKLGVTFVLVTEQEGVSWRSFHNGLGLWREKQA